MSEKHCELNIDEFEVFSAKKWKLKKKQQILILEKK